MNEDQLTTRDIAQATKSVALEPTHTENAANAQDRVDVMFPAEEANGYRTRWDAIQTGFVDEPRKAVEEADALVAQSIKRLSEVFADERTRLESQWDRGEQISTEDLRLALRKYRSFFERLLSV